MCFVLVIEILSRLCFTRSPCRTCSERRNTNLSGERVSYSSQSLELISSVDFHPQKNPINICLLFSIVAFCKIILAVKKVENMFRYVSSDTAFLRIIFFFAHLTSWQHSILLATQALYDFDLNSQLSTYRFVISMSAQ